MQTSITIIKVCTGIQNIILCAALLLREVLRRIKGWELNGHVLTT